MEPFSLVGAVRFHERVGHEVPRLVQQHVHLQRGTGAAEPLGLGHFEVLLQTPVDGLGRLIGAEAVNVPAAHPGTARVRSDILLNLF